MSVTVEVPPAPPARQRRRLALPRQGRSRVPAATIPAKAALLPPVRGQVVRSEDGTALHVETFGPDGAPTLLLVHGWTCAIRFWNAQIRALAGPFRVVAFDLRGHGRSAPARSGDYSPHAFAADVSAVLEAVLAPGEKALVLIDRAERNSSLHPHDEMLRIVRDSWLRRNGVAEVAGDFDVVAQPVVRGTGGRGGGPEAGQRGQRGQRAAEHQGGQPQRSAAAGRSSGATGFGAAYPPGADVQGGNAPTGPGSEAPPYSGYVANPYSPSTARAGDQRNPYATPAASSPPQQANTGATPGVGPAPRDESAYRPDDGPSPDETQQVRF